MRSYLATLRQLTLPYGARIPTDPALVMGPDLPIDMSSQYPQFKAAIIGYVGSFNPLLTTPQIKYHFIALFVDANYNSMAQGYVVVPNATIETPGTNVVKVTFVEGQDNLDGTKPNRSAIVLGPNATVGTVNDYVQLLGALYVNQTLRILNSSDDLNGWRNWKAGSFANGWSNFGGAFATFAVKRSVTGMVSLRGVIKPGTTADGTVMATLPTDDKGNRAWDPAYDQALTARSGNATGLVGLYITTGGNVTLQTNGSAIPAPVSFVWMNHTWEAGL